MMDLLWVDVACVLWLISYCMTCRLVTLVKVYSGLGSSTFCSSFSMFFCVCLIIQKLHNFSEIQLWDSLRMIEMYRNVLDWLKYIVKIKNIYILWIAGWNKQLKILFSHPDRHKPRTSIRIKNYRSCVENNLPLLKICRVEK
jgi:hypothetical protein